MKRKLSIINLYRISLLLFFLAVISLSIFSARQKREIDLLQRRANVSSRDGTEKTKEKVEGTLKQHGLEVDDVTVRVENEERCELNFYLDELTDLAVLNELPPNITLVSLNIGGTKVSDLGPLESKYPWELRLEELAINETPVSSLTPLVGHPLRWIDISASKVADLTPLQSTPLTSLYANGTRVRDLSPLKGKRLENLELSYTHVTDICVLKGMPIEELDISGTQISDLTPLSGMPLSHLSIMMTPVSDLTPIKDMNLYSLAMDLTKVTDLKVVAGMQLKILSIRGTDISDLTPLDGMNLDMFMFDPWKIKKGIDIIRAMPDLSIISIGFENEYTYLDVAEFWRRYDNGEFLAGAKKWKSTEELNEFFIQAFEMMNNVR